MIRSALAVAAVMLGVAAPTASAHPRPHGFGVTYPVASSLCSRVAAGYTPERLAGDATQITAACSALTGSYQNALSTYTTAVAPIAGEVQSTLATVRAARQIAEQTHSWTAYAAAVKQALITLKDLGSRERTDQQTYIAAIRAARVTFWTTIHGLPGAGSLPTDTGAPPVPAAPVVPSAA
ncbi:MAG: hypothetical protein ACLP4R_22555 [Solirubrobacteraceae bacterium]